MNLERQGITLSETNTVYFWSAKKKQNTEDEEDPDLWGCNLGLGCNLGSHTYSQCPQ